MDKINLQIAGDIGIRFLLFRKAIRKTREEISVEMNLPVEEVTDIENGESVPEINYLHYMSQNYGLNINWMLCWDGEMFIKNPPIEPDKNFVPAPRDKSGESVRRENTEFILLMQIPAIKKAILDRMEEFKDQLRAIS